MRGLPWSEFHTTVHIEVYRVKCPACGVKIEKVPLLPSEAPFSKRFEDAVGLACESASAGQVARRNQRNLWNFELDSGDMIRNIIPRHTQGTSAALVCEHENNAGSFRHGRRCFPADRGRTGAPTPWA